MSENSDSRFIFVMEYTLNQSWLRNGIFSESQIPISGIRDRIFNFGLDRKILKIPKSRDRDRDLMILERSRVKNFNIRDSGFYGIFHHPNFPTIGIFSWDGMSRQKANSAFNDENAFVTLSCRSIKIFLGREFLAAF